MKARPRDDDDQIDPAEYARLLDSYDNSFRNIAEGEVVKGTVLKVTASEVIVDVGYKSEGLIAIEEFTDRGGELSVRVGEEVDVLLEKTEDDLLNITNFGQKSLDEVKQKLDERGLTLRG